MKIGGLGSVKSSSGTKKRRSVGSVSSFAELLGAASSSGADAADGPGSVNAVAPATNLLAAQEVGDEASQRNTLIKEGENTLDALENLRRQILSGSISIETLREIKSRINTQKAYTQDPELQAIIREIELRASVELAKLETAWTNQQAAQASVDENNDI